LPPAESEGRFVGLVLLLVEVLVTMPIPCAIKSPTPPAICELGVDCIVLVKRVEDEVFVTLGYSKAFLGITERLAILTWGALQEHEAKSIPLGWAPI
jgi:hypothetical protein